MSIRSLVRPIASALSLAGLLAGCDPTASAGAIGAQPLGAIGSDDKQGEVVPPALPERPGPGGVTPTLDPPVDVLRDPVELPRGGRGGIDGGDARLPPKLTDPAAKGGCRCHLQCGPVNDDGSKDCITICEGSGCD